MESEQKVKEGDFFKTFKEYRCAGHKKTGYALDWNCNGKFLASADVTIKIWKLDNLALTKEKDLRGHNEVVESIAWHPKEPHILASTSKDGALKIWDINKTKNSRNEKTKPDTFLMSWSPDGQIIASGTKEGITFYNANSNPFQIINTLKFPNFQEISEFSWDPSGQIFLVTGSNKNVGLIYVLDGRNLKLPPIEQLESHRALINCIAFDQNEKYFATGANDSLVLVYDLAEMVAIKSFNKVDGIVKKLSFSHDSKYLATASEDNYIDIYNTEQDWLSYRINVSASQNAVKWHPKSYILAHIGEDKISKDQDETTIHLFGKLNQENQEQ